MTLYLVRHAKAGERASWEGDDRLRPLSKRGRAQAAAIAEALAGHRPPRLLSSPYVRCRQTLEPLGSQLGLEVEPCELLEEGSPFEPALELLTELPDHSVLCSHGDLIPDLIGALHRRGADLVGTANWKKGVVWTLTRVDGTVRRMEATPPPSD